MFILCNPLYNNERLLFDWLREREGEKEEQNASKNDDRDFRLDSAASCGLGLGLNALGRIRDSLAYKLHKTVGHWVEVMSIT